MKFITLAVALLFADGGWDVNGIEIINAANKVDLLATSDTKTIIIALTNVFIIIYIFNNT